MPRPGLELTTERKSQKLLRGTGVLEWRAQTVLASNSDLKGSACFYGQFSLDKTWTLQAGSSVLPHNTVLETCMHVLLNSERHLPNSIKHASRGTFVFLQGGPSGRITVLG